MQICRTVLLAGIMMSASAQANIFDANSEDTISYTIDKSDLFQFQERNTKLEKTLNTYGIKYKSVDNSAVTFTVKKRRQEIEEGGVLKDSALNFLNWLVNKSRIRDYKNALDKYQDRLKIVAEGDSWFLHPLQSDVVDLLVPYYNIRSLAAAGDNMVSYYKTGQYAEALAEEHPDVLLLSGGGNDILKENMPFVLKYFYPDINNEGPARLIKPFFHDKLDEVMTIYKRIFTEMAEDYPNTITIVHGYDYTIPSKNGPFIGKPMLDKGIADLDEQREVMSYIANTFNSHLQQLAAEFDDVYYVNLRGITGDDRWTDEIHPNEDAFADITREIRKKILNRYHK